MRSSCADYDLTPKLLGEIFEVVASPIHSSYSRVVTIRELLNIHRSFRSTNGNQWARDNVSYLGKKYIVKRTLEAGRVVSIKLDGINDSREKNRGISAEVKQAFSGKKCVILDVKASKMEIDHKNARYDSSANERLDTQKVDDFQPLSKAANDAKRQHCKTCKECGKRYDARRLGYSTPYIFGNEKSKTCPGCYWYDPHYFNEVVSKSWMNKKRNISLLERRY